jgi:hypothetical protein
MRTLISRRPKQLLPFLTLRGPHEIDFELNGHRKAWEELQPDRSADWGMWHFIEPVLKLVAASVDTERVPFAFLYWSGDAFATARLRIDIALGARI